MNFKDLPIRSKITTMVVAISIISLIVAGLIFGQYDKAQYRQQMLNNTTILADVVGDNNTANLM